MLENGEEQHLLSKTLPIFGHFKKPIVWDGLPCYLRLTTLISMLTIEFALLNCWLNIMKHCESATDSLIYQFARNMFSDSQKLFRESRYMRTHLFVRSSVTLGRNAKSLVWYKWRKNAGTNNPKPDLSLKIWRDKSEKCLLEGMFSLSQCRRIWFSQGLFIIVIWGLVLSRDYRLFIMSWRCSLFLNNLCLYL